MTTNMPRDADNVFDDLVIKMNTYFRLVPLRLNSRQIPEFHHRTVALQVEEMNIAGYNCLVEVSFFNKKCYITCVELSSSQYQIISMWRKQAQRIILQKRLEQKIESGNVFKDGLRVQFAEVKISKKTKMDNIKKCFESLLDQVDMKYGKITLYNVPGT